MVECIEHVIRKAREEINEEPRLQIIHTDDLRFGDDFSAGANESSVEVKDDVNEEDDIHNGVNNEEAHIFGCFVLEGNIVGHHNSCVESEAKNYPIPYRLEGTIVEKNVWRRLRRFLTVLRKNVCVQAHHLLRIQHKHTLCNLLSLRIVSN